MRLFFGALALASLMFCLAAERKSKLPKHRPTRIITSAYLLDGKGFDAENATLDSQVGKWLKGVQEKAQVDLNKEFKLDITFNITEINITDNDITNKIQYWSSDSLIHGPTFLDYLEEYYQNRDNPDIICVVTRYRMYDSEEVNYLAYVKHTTLYHTMVPMLLTYVPEKEAKTGELLFKLVQRSITSNQGRWGKYFKNCNKPKKVKEIKSRQSIQSSP
ncbi:uncharacterized protein LOC120836801 [Ixodes scapularis]|uniref:uncharacterized protein LOC120836801 n=1 Tax=Ixodes scapularis TaxID=6945 RepID=UPI001A9CD354|nr:uncharacterized protein LOC120836801 [Ixodes scapularis]